MEQAKHTPGPWEIREGTYGHASTYDWQIVNKDGEYVCDGDGEANARLITAAPELLDALQAVLDYGSMTGASWIEDKARAAIAKALGE